VLVLMICLSSTDHTAEVLWAHQQSFKTAVLWRRCCWRCQLLLRPCWRRGWAWLLPRGVRRCPRPRPGCPPRLPLPARPRPPRLPPGQAGAAAAAAAAVAGAHLQGPTSSMTTLPTAQWPNSSRTVLVSEHSGFVGGHGCRPGRCRGASREVNPGTLAHQQQQQWQQQCCVCCSQGCHSICFIQPVTCM